MVPVSFFMSLKSGSTQRFMNKKIDVSQQTGFDLFLIGNFTYKSLLGAIFGNQGLWVESEDNARNQRICQSEAEANSTGLTC